MFPMRIIALAGGLATLALLGIVLVMLARPDLAARGGARLGIHDRPELGHFYRQMVGHHRRVAREVAPGSVLFYGSSSVQGLNVLRVSPVGVNFGIGGDTTRGLRERLVDERLLRSAAAVVLAIGRNDRRWRGVAETLAIHEQVVARIPASVPIVMSGVQPYSVLEIERVESLDPAGLAVLNEGIRAICSRRPLCVHVALEEHVRDAAGFLSPDYHEADGVHLNRRGYRIWHKLLRDAVAAIGAPAASQ